MTEKQFITPYGKFNLSRSNRPKKDSLRAWDAADEYLLQVISERDLLSQKPLIGNDAFGALSIALHQYQPVNWSDSFTAHRVMKMNLQHNAIAEDCVTCLDSLQTPSMTLQLVLIKVPKTLALLEHQLISLRPLMNADTTILVAGMVKHIPSTLWKLLEKLIGPTQTSRALKKARVIEVSMDGSLKQPDNPYPVKWQLEDSRLEITSHANVFSRDKLDVGTRFMLQHLPMTEGEGDIVDLGCGNGILALVSAQQNPLANIHCVDESYMAIASTKENFKQLDSATFSTGRQVSFHVNSDLNDFKDASVDLVLCNPPFHQNQNIGGGVARNMFRQAARILRPGSELWVVGNRHLGYHQVLRQFYDRVSLVASNKKFVILKATTRP